MPVYSITPDDVLFFRDGRPMEGSALGHGCRWPMPSLLFGAIHAALYRAFPEPQPWEHAHREGCSGRRDYSEANRPSKRFGSLTTAGPFPILGNQWLFPCPTDAAPCGLRLAPLRAMEGRNDLPRPLTCSVAALHRTEKTQACDWVEGRSYRDALHGKPFTPRRQEDIYLSEHVTGIGIDTETGTQDGNRIYSAEYMRLKSGVHLGLMASMPLKERDRAEGLDRLLVDGSILLCGGQQRSCHVHKLPDDVPLPLSHAVAGDRVKWVLLSPAVFPAITEERKTEDGMPCRPHPGGWLPNWIDAESGRVMLRKGDTARRAGERRDDWRKRVRGLPPIDCRLMAAAVPKPVAVSGWDAECGREKPVLMAVPAGAVYYFEGPDAPALADALAWHGSSILPSSVFPSLPSLQRRSTLLGEQGFGIGVCAPWEYLEDVAERP